MAVIPHWSLAMLPITAPTMVAATGCGSGTAQTWAPYLSEAADAYEISTPQRLAAFLAELGEESAGFSRTVENLNYSAGGLMETWPHHFEHLVDAFKVQRNPQAIAGAVYDGRMGNTQPGDGWRYRGRGLIQVTGKANYEAIRDALRARFGDQVPDFLSLPDALAEPRWAAMSAGAYWHDHDLNTLADAMDFDAITRRINGGTEGAAERRKRYALARGALKA